MNPVNIEALKIRNVTYNDIQLVFDWANEESVRKQSFKSELISWDEHRQWFSKRILVNSYWYILCSDSTELGICRFDFIDSNSLSLNYSIQKKFRGQNLGLFLIELSLKKVSLEIGNEKIYIAKVKKENIASAKVFQKVGFSLLTDDSDLLTYSLHL